jgi:DNA polymerase III subunit gamma/tau
MTDRNLFLEEDNAPKGQEYKVLARKYRPYTFENMIGQKVLVRTFANAISSDRIAHAFILTGIRGVGKTTAARIIAKSLNCIGKDGKGGITMEPCGVCANCKAITDDRHQDVLEMDAASHTGVNDIREIIESSKYKPIIGRYKIFIIDEVHMLSNSAFNALLKTLEEPPGHIKFIFATTEIRKIPITILSRCQRFDLKRVDVSDLVSHFNTIIEEEGAFAEQNALKIIAVNSGGSVRDGLSILDQALTHTNNNITELAIREMLGLSDVEQIYDLFKCVVTGEINRSLEISKEMYDKGADPTLMVADLLNVCHTVSKLKHTDKNIDLPETELKHARILADSIEISSLARLWQMLLKGSEEIKNSVSQISALEMVLIRIAYTSALPSPEDILKKIRSKNQDVEKVAGSIPGGKEVKCEEEMDDNVIVNNEVKKNSNKPNSFQEIIDALFKADELILYHQLKNEVSFVSIENNRLLINLSNNAPKGLHFNLQEVLERITNEKWSVVLSSDEGQKPLAHQEKLDTLQKTEAIRNHPTVKNILNSFTGMEIADIKLKKEN